MSTPKKTARPEAPPEPIREVAPEDQAKIEEALEALAYAVREDFPDRPALIGFFLRSARNDAYKKNSVPCDDPTPDATHEEMLDAFDEVAKVLDGQLGWCDVFDGVVYDLTRAGLVHHEDRRPGHRQAGAESGSEVSRWPADPQPISCISSFVGSGPPPPVRGRPSSNSRPTPGYCGSTPNAAPSGSASPSERPSGTSSGATGTSPKPTLPTTTWPAEYGGPA